MRHSYNYIALSLLAAAFAGCSSTDTGSTSTSSSGGQDPLTGPLAEYQAKIKPLGATTTFASATGAVTITIQTKELVVLSKRLVDSALLINGFPCPADTTTHVAATTTNIKSIAIAPAALDTVPDTSGETVLIDIRNGTFAAASASGGGISINLGLTGASGAPDTVAVLGSTGSDKLGCKQLLGADAIGLKSATSQDVKIAHSGSTYSALKIDLNDGDDSFDQGDCVTQMSIFGGKGKDVITATAEPAVGVTLKADTFSGGADADTLSYANRTTAVTINASLNTVNTLGTLHAGRLANEGTWDVISDDFETLTGGSGDDIIAGGTLLTAYTLNGGPGADKFITAVGHGCTINGGTGTDVIDYSGRLAKVSANMADGKAADGQDGDTDNIGKDVENYVATAFGDTVVGNALNNVFTGGTQGDSFSGGDGDDTFVAGVTPDGSDVFNGGAGSDTIDYSARPLASPNGVCINMDGTATSGTCAVTISATTTDPATWPLASGETDTIGLDVENAVGTSGTDHIVGNASANVILGLGGLDRLEGGLGNDTIDANSYYTGAGNHNWCNPVTLACYGTVLVACDCATAVLTTACAHTGTINNNTAIVCGGDPLDVASCTTGATAPSAFTGCAMQQVN